MGLIKTTAENGRFLNGASHAQQRSLVPSTFSDSSIFVADRARLQLLANPTVRLQTNLPAEVVEAQNNTQSFDYGSTQKSSFVTEVAFEDVYQPVQLLTVRFVRPSGHLLIVDGTDAEYTFQYDPENPMTPDASISAYDAVSDEGFGIVVSHDSNGGLFALDILAAMTADMIELGFRAIIEVQLKRAQVIEPPSDSGPE